MARKSKKSNGSKTSVVSKSLPPDPSFPDQIRFLFQDVEVGYEYAAKHNLGDPLIIQNRGKHGVEFIWVDPGARKISVRECNESARAMHQRLMKPILDDSNARLRKSNEMYVAAIDERNATVKGLVERCNELLKRR